MNTLESMRCRVARDTAMKAAIAAADRELEETPRVGGPPPKHGGMTAYRRHIEAGEPLCELCEGAPERRRELDRKRYAASRKRRGMA